EAPLGQPRPSLRVVELRLRDVAQELLHEATTCVTAEYGTGRRGNQRACPCGGMQRFKGMHRKEVTDLQGKTLRVERAYYVCRQCERGCATLDEELGLGRNELTPALADIVELMGVVCPFESAARLLKRSVGIDLSGEWVRRATEKTGKRCLDA